MKRRPQENRAARPDRYGRLEPFAKLAFILAGVGTDFQLTDKRT